MIETIWPLSVLSCGRDTGLGGKQQNLIGLRTFVQEVLRRSKTSYSTLQVALYYLILIQSCLPRHDFTMEQSVDSPACRALQCGRRMFLAALILASKYLQDRNYSARAWSKISGLGTCEININEMAFLSAVKWKLHIPEPVFHRWTDIVLKYSPSAQVNTSPRSSPLSSQTWKRIVPLLTPELDLVSSRSGELSDDLGYNSPRFGISDMSPPPLPVREGYSPISESDEPTPRNSYATLKTLEPTPREPKAEMCVLPPLPHLATLPTPQMTPQTGTFCTPAVRASGRHSGRSMGCAMEIHNSVIARNLLDYPHKWRSDGATTNPTSSRRSSLANSTSSGSSPESMISDVSSQSYRSSSILSGASSNCALPLPMLAVQATRRCANMHLSGLKEEDREPVPMDDDNFKAWLLHGRSNKRTYPEPQAHAVTSYQTEGLPAYRSETLREAAAGLWSRDRDSAGLHEAAAALHDNVVDRTCYEPRTQVLASREAERLSKHHNEYPPDVTAVVRESSRIRTCPKSQTHPATSYEAEGFRTYHNEDTRQAAAALRDLHLNQRNLSSVPAAVPRPQKGRKRSRPNSMDLSVQSSVRELIAPRCLGDITNKASVGDNKENAVLPDAKCADSFLVPKIARSRPSSSHSNSKPSLSGDALPRKKTCAGGNKGGKDEARMIMRKLKERAGMQEPGMLEGII